jgi:hypothetical protein
MQVKGELIGCNAIQVQKEMTFPIRYKLIQIDTKTIQTEYSIHGIKILHLIRAFDDF